MAQANIHRVVPQYILSALFHMNTQNEPMNLTILCRSLAPTAFRK